MVVFANIFASDQKDEMINRKHAIVFDTTVTVKRSPDASGTDLFVLHEGTNVTVKSTLGEWSEIELEDGNVGWMPSKDIEKICYMLEQLLVWERDAFFMLNGSDSALLDHFMWIYSGKAV